MVENNAWGHIYPKLLDICFDFEEKIQGNIEHFSRTEYVHASLDSYGLKKVSPCPARACNLAADVFISVMHLSDMQMKEIAARPDGTSVFLS